MNDIPAPAPWLQQTPKELSNIDAATGNVSEALECLHRRLEALVSRLKPVTRLPEPMAPTAQQPAPPKPFDASSPVLSMIYSWERTITALSDKMIELEKNLDI